MFTGIIEQIGLVVSLIKNTQVGKIAVSAPKIFDEVKVGESIAVNGVCLTVVNCRRGFAEFDLSSETLRTTNLGEIKIGDKVNLERSLPISGRLGGHLVSGHVDGVGEIKNKVIRGDLLEIYLSLPSDLLRYLVPKGSIAIDGISLTVADFHDGVLRLLVIPHTAKNTTLGMKNVGDRVNIEVDILSKYIERHLRGEPREGVSEETLVRLGFIPLGWTDN
ncbi:MAG: riboflavin synthase [Candidatus Margulisiibacteriota bacterium]